jgi:hypothetical protein
MRPSGIYARKHVGKPPGLRRHLRVDGRPSPGRPSLTEADLDGPDTPTRTYSPEQVLAMHVIWQAVSDVYSASGSPQDRDTAAQFLLGCGAYAGIHAFWCALVGVPARAAVEQVMLKHGTVIARVRAHGVREMMRRQAEARRRGACAI